MFYCSCSLVNVTQSEVNITFGIIDNLIVHVSQANVTVSDVEFKSLNKNVKTQSAVFGRFETATHSVHEISYNVTTREHI